MFGLRLQLQGNNLGFVGISDSQVLLLCLLCNLVALTLVVALKGDLLDKGG